MIPGHQLAIPLDDGRVLFGVACARHGLRYYCKSKPGKVARAGEMQCVDGATPPEPLTVATCDECGAPLGGAILGAGSIPVPEAALEALETFA